MLIKLGAMWLRPYLWSGVGALVAVVVAALMVLAFTAGLRGLVDNGILRNDSQALIQHGLQIWGYVLVMALAAWVRARLVNHVADNVVADMRLGLMQRWLAQPPLNPSLPASELSTRLGADLQVVHGFISTQLLMLVRHTVLLVGGIILTLSIKPILVLVALAAAGTLLVPLLLLAKPLKRLANQAQSAQSLALRFAADSAQHHAALVVAGVERYLLQTLAQLFITQRQAAAARARVRGWMGSLMLLCGLSALLAMVGYAGLLLMRGVLTAGDLTSFFLAAVVMAGAAVALSDSAGEWYNLRGAMARLWPLLQQPAPVMLDAAEKSAVPQTLRLQGITLGYPERPDSIVQRDLSCAITAGEKLTIVGDSGVGKTSLLLALVGLLPPQAGEIFYGDTAQTSVSPTAWRQHFAYMPQQPALLSASVLDNITLGRAIPEPEIWQALQQAAAADFVRALPQGLATLVGERGAELSGGQQARLMVARVILQRAGVWLLDEPTAALDAVTEQQVFATLRQVAATVVVVSHRPAAAVMADRVMLLNASGIAALGTHNALLAMPEYRRLMDSAV